MSAMEKSKDLSDSMKSIAHTGESTRKKTASDTGENNEIFDAHACYMAAVYGPPEVLFGLGWNREMSGKEEFDPAVNCEPDDYGPPEIPEIDDETENGNVKKDEASSEDES